MFELLNIVEVGPKRLDDTFPPYFGFENRLLLLDYFWVFYCNILSGFEVIFENGLEFTVYCGFYGWSAMFWGRDFYLFTC